MHPTINRDMNILKPLGAETHLETVAVLKATSRAAAALGELKGAIHSIPNKAVLLNTLPLQEAKASSEIENIVTTEDELFRSHIDKTVNGPAKEVRAHAKALLLGFELLEKKKMLRLDDILKIHIALAGNDAGLRRQSGTVLKNSVGETVYTPPPPEDVPSLMDNLITFINDSGQSSLDSLVKMAVIHHQFESIHPFYDGNGRTGRILNLLYLALAKRLDLPVLYLSRYIIASKGDYYRLLQAVRDEGSWEEWLCYMLNGITTTAKQTITLVEVINELMQRYKDKLRKQLPALCSQDLVDTLFKHPYTKIKYVATDLNCHRQTATNYLDKLSEHGLLEKVRHGRSNYYINTQLVSCLMNIHHPEEVSEKT